MVYFSMKLASGVQRLSDWGGLDVWAEFSLSIIDLLFLPCHLFKLVLCVLIFGFWVESLFQTVVLISLICVVIETLRHPLTLSVSGRDEEEDWSVHGQINTTLWSSLLQRWGEAYCLKINLHECSQPSMYVLSVRRTIWSLLFLGTEPACNPVRDMPPNRVCFCLRDKLLEFFWENDNLSEDRIVSFSPTRQLHFGRLSNGENLKWLSIYPRAVNTTWS